MFQKNTIKLSTIIVVTALHMFCGTLASQNSDYEWWNEVHNWDGVTHWSNYIITSPYYLGPNALTVPFSQKGKVTNRYEFQTGLEGHFSNGDNTQNIYLRLYAPIVKNIVAVELCWVPFEHYSMSENIVYERRGRNRSGEGTAVGDIYLSTIFQLTKNRKVPDMALRVALRTASGSKLSDARYTDAPGYFFDLSMGREFEFSEKVIDKVGLYGMLGFYVWQMNLPNNKQNDAFLFGLGADVKLSGFVISNAIEGYLGYMGNREIIVVKEEPVVFNDRPVLYRLDLKKENEKIDIILGYQLGLNDFSYQSVKLSVTYHLERIGNKK